VLFIMLAVIELLISLDRRVGNESMCMEEFNRRGRADNYKSKEG